MGIIMSKDNNNLITHILSRNDKNNKTPVLKQLGIANTSCRVGVSSTTGVYADSPFNEFVKYDYDEYVGFLEPFVLGHYCVTYVPAWAGLTISDRSFFGSPAYLPDTHAFGQLKDFRIARFEYINEEGEPDFSERRTWAFFKSSDGHPIITNWFLMEMYWTSSVPNGILCFLATDEFYVNDSDYPLKLEDLVHPPFEFINYRCDTNVGFISGIESIFGEGTEIYKLLGSKPLYSWDNPLPTRNGSGKVRIYTDSSKPKPNKVYVYDSSDVPHVFWHSLYDESCYLPLDIVPIGDGRYYALTIRKHKEPNPNILANSRYTNPEEYPWHEISLELIESKDKIIKVATVAVPKLDVVEEMTVDGFYYLYVSKTIAYHEDGEYATQYIKDMMQSMRDGTIENIVKTLSGLTNIHEGKPPRFGFRDAKAMVLCEEE